MAQNNRDLFRDYINQTLEGNDLTSPVLWDFVKYSLRAFLCGLKRQTFLTLVTLCGVISTPWMLSNFAGGMMYRQVNTNQPMPGIIAGQAGNFARQVVDVGGHVSSSTIQYVSNQQAPGLSPIQANRLVRQQMQQQPTSVLTTGMGQY